MARYTIKVFENHQFSSMGDITSKISLGINKILTYSVKNRDAVEKELPDIIGNSVRSIHNHCSEFRKVIGVSDDYPIIDPIFEHIILVYRQGNKNNKLRKRIVINSKTYMSNSLKNYFDKSSQNIIYIQIENYLSQSSYEGMINKYKIDTSLSVVFNTISQMIFNFTYDINNEPIGNILLPPHACKIVTEEEYENLIKSSISININKVEDKSSYKEFFTKDKNNINNDFIRIISEAKEINNSLKNKEGENKDEPENIENS